MKYNYLLLTTLISLFQLPAFAQQRPVERQICIETDSAILRIQLWDAGVEDNDTISLLVNGHKLLDRLRLTKEKQEFSFKLQPGDNEFVLFAENLGDIPNNTAAISINGQEKRSLNSGLEKSGSMNVRYKAPGHKYTMQVCETVELPDDAEAATIRQNPTWALPSYQLMKQGIRLNSNDAFRKIDVQDCYNSSSREVILEVWDCGVEDNDTISLYLNGEWVLRDFRLAKKSHEVKVQLKAGENMLVMYAHNLGDIPNNTSALAVKTAYSRQEVGTMMSDANTCGAITIYYGNTDEYGNTFSPCLDENKIDSTKEPEWSYRGTTAPNNPGVRPGKPSSPAPRPTTPARRPVIVVPPSTRPAPPASRPSPSTSPTPTTKPSGRQPGDNPGGNPQRDKPAH